jgi:hypothetical protein
MNRYLIIHLLAGFSIYCEFWHLQGNDSPDALRYLNRDHKFKTLSIFNEALSLSAGVDSTNPRCELKSIQTVHPYRFMYEKVENKCFVLRDRLRNLTDGIIEVNQLRERAKDEGRDFILSPVHIASQERVWCCGRICTEGDTGTLNPFSVALEGANGRYDLDSLKSLSSNSVAS